MSKIMTVLGEIKPEELGFTSMHEHIMMNGGKTIRSRYESQIPKSIKVKVDEPVSLENIGLLKRNFILSWDALSLDDEEMMTGEAADFKEAGGSALVEMSAIGLRCNVPAIRRISESTGLHVVATTGFYTEDSWPEEYRNMTVREYQNKMLHEIKYGIDDTGVFPGHLKIGMTHLSKQEEKTLRAAARVAVETGLSLTVHPCTRIGGNAVKISKILIGEGMEADRIVIAHVTGTFTESNLKNLVLNPESRKIKLEVARELLDLGVNISTEFLGNSLDIELAGSIGGADWQRMAGLVALLNEGYAEHIVLGTDLCAKMMARRAGGEGYCRLTNFVIPALMDVGVSDYAIRQITVENPARILAY